MEPELIPEARVAMRPITVASPRFITKPLPPPAAAREKIHACKESKIDRGVVELKRIRAIEMTK